MWYKNKNTFCKLKLCSYRYWWLAAKPRQRGAKCGGERAFNINRKHGLFYLKYFENGPLEPGYKMCSLQKNPLKWSPQKRSTYHELLPNFIFPLDLDNGARICSACRIALTSSKYKQSAETFVDVSKHFQFSLFWNGKGTQILKKYHCKFQRAGCFVIISSRYVFSF